VGEGSVSTAGTEDRRHDAARHGAPRRRVSDRGQCARAVLEVRGGGRERRLFGVPLAFGLEIKAIMADVYRAVPASWRLRPC
jgi:hypothetical protein